MKTRKFEIASVIVIIVVIVVIVISPKDIYYDIVNKKLWTELSQQFENDKVTEVSIDNVEGDSIDKDDIINALKSSQFYKSNWRGEGPTGTILSITLKDGHTQNFQYWGGGILETTFKDGQFLIRSNKLKAVFDKYGISN